MLAIQGGRTKYNYRNDVDSVGFTSHHFDGNIGNQTRITKIKHKCFFSSAFIGI